MTLNEWQKIIGEAARKKYNNQNWTQQDRLLSILRQLGDVSKAVQRDRGILKISDEENRKLKSTAHRAAALIADILIFCDENKIDLEKELPIVFDWYNNTINSKYMLALPSKWIIDSLNIIKDKNDAPLAGGFAGSVMEALGRVSLYPDGEKGEAKNQRRFYEFIERYLKECNPSYLNHKETLWRFMRCDGAHNVLAQYGAIFGGREEDRIKHLTVRSDITDDKGRLLNIRALFISLPRLMEDLIWAVEKFSYNLEQDTLLQKQHRKVVDRLCYAGEKYINDNFPLDDKI